MSKRIAMVLLALCMVLCLLPANPANAETYTGTCGENVTWSLDTENGILTISGVGDMVFTYDEAPWTEYREIITSVLVEDGITNIAGGAFWHCYGLESVTIPDSVTVIDMQAFLLCESLTDVVIPDGVTEIGMCAFMGCSSLTSITIPKSVTSIGFSAFAECRNLRDVYILSETVVAELTAEDCGGSLLMNAENVYVENSIASVPEYITTRYPYMSVIEVDGVSYNKYSMHIEHEHDYIEVDSWTFGCEEPLYTAYECSICGDYKTTVGDPLGHFWDDGVVITEPTEETDGAMLYTCEICGETKTEELHVHKYAAVVTAPTCTTDGYTTYTCDCGDSYVVDEVAALGHNWDEGVVTTEPTEDTAGVKTYTCTTCGETKTEELPKLEHVHSHEAVVTAPTCEQGGYTTYTCACGDSYVADEVAALGHTWDEGIVTTEPTEETVGVKTYTCTTCGETKTEEIPVLEHIHKHETVVTAPTCTTGGYTTYTCACGDSYIADEVIALGHTEVTVDGKAATCTEAGLTDGVKCSVCFQTVKEQEEITALGHNYVDGKCTVCSSPPTGDNAAVLLVLVSIIAMTGTAAVVLKKKCF